ncbi:MAG: hypothetical protein QM756_02535 [Polyangiaceae bacterium]
MFPVLEQTLMRQERAQSQSLAPRAQSLALRAQSLALRAQSSAQAREARRALPKQAALTSRHRGNPLGSALARTQRGTRTQPSP